MLRKPWARVHAEQLQSNQFVTKSASATLKPYERFVKIDSTGGAVTITLPPVAEMIGEMIVLYVSAFTSAITIAAADSVDFAAPTFDGVDDGQVLWSDGQHWWPLSTRT